MCVLAVDGNLSRSIVATKRERKGRLEFIIKRSKLSPERIYLVEELEQEEPADA